MGNNVFLLATDPNSPCRDVIHSRDSGLRIRVYCLEEERFRPNNNEIQLYGTTGNNTYAFETIGIASEDAPDIIEAIQWYADYIRYPDMDIAPEDPRAGKEVAI